LRISVALCTYNGAAFLRQQLISIATQTRPPGELVVCDDASTDDTRKILSAFRAEASFPVRLYFNQTNLGSTKNFAQAIELCDGDVIALADQDDVWHIEKLAHIESAFAASPDLAALFSNGSLIDGQGQSLRGSLWQSVGFLGGKQSAVRANKGFDVLLRGNFVTGATLSFRSRDKSLLLPIPAGWVHDYWIATLLAVASRIDYIDAELIQYRCHASQQLGVKRHFARQWRQLFETNKHAYLDAEKKWLQLYERLSGNGLSPDAPEMVKCRAGAAHMRRRGDLPRQRLRRLPIMLKDICNGSYFRYSSGLSSVLRDILAR
jgi:glycosyltransferase involved in cell wall biosynthesis